MNIKLIKELKTIFEKTAAKRRGIVLPRIEDVLKKYVNKGYYIQFSKINKLGVYPKSEYNTPIGVYSYPLTSKIYHQYINGMIPFASGRKFLILFKYAGRNLWDVNEYMDNNEYEKFIDWIKEYIIKKYKYEEDEVDEVIYDAVHDSRYDSNSGILWNVTRYLTGRNSKKWALLLNKGLKFDGVIDNGSGIIHPNERTQAVFFSIKNLKDIHVFENKLTPKKISRRKKVESRKRVKYLSGDILKFRDEYIRKNPTDRNVVFPGDRFKFSNSHIEKISKKLLIKKQYYKKVLKKIRYTAVDFETVVLDNPQSLDNETMIKNRIIEPILEVYPNSIIAKQGLEKVNTGNVSALVRKVNAYIMEVIRSTPTDYKVIVKGPGIVQHIIIQHKENAVKMVKMARIDIDYDENY